MTEPVKSAVKGECCHFLRFISRGNVIDLAVGTILGGAFGKIVTSFVNDVLGPFLSLITTHSLEDSYWVIRNGPNAPYKNHEDAKRDEAIVIRWGPFLQRGINFLLQGICLYFFIRMIDEVKKVPSMVEESTGWSPPVM